MKAARSQIERRNYFLTILIVIALVGAWSLIDFREARPGPHYDAGYPPGTICTNHGTAGGVVCERDRNFKGAEKTAPRISK